MAQWLTNPTRNPAAPIRPLAWEPTYAEGAALEKAKRQKNKQTNKQKPKKTEKRKTKFSQLPIIQRCH